MKKNMVKKFVLSTFLIAGIQTSVFAQENVDELIGMSLEELMDLKIKTGSFLELNLSKSPLSMTIIDKEQIQNSGSRTMSELLEIYVPGFQYMFNKWNGDIWGMRGIAVDRNTKIIYLVNGLKMNHETRDGAYSEINLGLMGDIERVEVLRGPAGLVYGSGAIAGVVNVVTKTPDKNSSNLSASYGSWNSQIVEAATHTQLSDKTSMSISMGLRKSDGIGNRTSRVYGSNSWPSDGAVSPNGELTDGSAWITPGNLRLGIDLKHDNFSLYTRFTRQRHSTGQFFIVDPWPEIVGTPDEKSEKKTLEGKTIDFNSPLSKTESWGNNRRENIVENMSVDAKYAIPFDKDSINLQAAFIGATNRIQTDFRDGYQVSGVEPRAGFISQTIGDKRYFTSAQYLMNRVDNLNSAFGLEFRIDDLGKDLQGLNMHDGLTKRPNVSNVLYTNFAFYTENLYSLKSGFGDFDFIGGVRFDKHTRTAGVFSPKLAVVYSPVKEHSIKAIFQSSANNGSVDNYEFNWRHYKNDGTVSKVPQLEDPKNKDGTVVPAVTAEELQSLKPETIMSFELASSHQFGKNLTFNPSLSYNSASNLFVWSQELFRVVNGGQFNFLTAEADLNYQMSGFTVGLSHSFQRPVVSTTQKQTFEIPETKVVADPKNEGQYVAEVVPGQMKKVEIDSTKNQITTDNNNFLNLATNVSKLYLTYKPQIDVLSFLTLHTNLRVFWGLAGRNDMFTEDEKKGENYLNASRSPIVKWNASAQFNLPYDFRLSAYAYDILGNAQNIHAVRWQQSAEPSQRELYTVDQTAFALKLERNF